MGKTADGEQLTPRQKKWFASVQATQERDTGKTLAEWVEIVRRDCQESQPGKRVAWLKAHYGLGVNRCAHILGEAFPSEMGWDDPDKLREALWTGPGLDRDPAGRRDGRRRFRRTGDGSAQGLHRLVAQAAVRGPQAGQGRRCGAGPGGAPDASPSLLEPRHEGWSERLNAKLPLAAPAGRPR